MKEPEVHQHITNLGLPWLIICSKWFICLFVEILPIEVSYSKTIPKFNF